MRVIEQETPFGESVLWQLQNEAYRSYGATAWTDKGVPSYLTSHPLLAKNYADQILAFVHSNQIDSLTLYDLGAGTGRLGYYLLSNLLASGIKLTVVMTDITETHLDGLASHPKLMPYIESKHLRLVKYHHSDASFPESIDGPVVVIANYYLDTLPQRLYRAHRQGVDEGFVTLQTTKGEGIEAIPHLEATFHYKPAFHVDPTVLSFASEVKEGLILQPYGGLKTLSLFTQKESPWLILLADQGIATEAQRNALLTPKIAKHGTFSVTVDYGYLRYYFTSQGFTCYLPPVPDSRLITMAVTNRPSPAIERFVNDVPQPVDYLTLSQATEQRDTRFDEACFDEALALVRLGLFDPINLYLFFPLIEEKYLMISAEMKEALASTLLRVIRTFYPISKEEAQFFNQMGVLLFKLHRYDEALICFQQNLLYSPGDLDTLKNITACLHHKDLQG